MLEPCVYRFTAAEGGARLANTASVQNTMVTECASFISTRLLHEQAYRIRGSLSSGCQRSVRICRSVNVKPDAYELRILTDLQVAEATEYEDIDDWSEELEAKEVLVCTSKVLRSILEDGILTMSQINVLIIDSCHLIYKDVDLQYIMKVYKQQNENERPRILALTYPLFGAPKSDTENDKPEETQLCQKTAIDDEKLQICEKESTNEEAEKQQVLSVEDMRLYENLDDFEMYEKLEWRIDQLEQELCCKMDLAEDIDGCKRISGAVTKPKEVIIEYSDNDLERMPDDYVDLVNFMKDNVRDVMEFLDDHRHDPTEIYGEELYDEFKNIPNPTIEPKQILNEFLYVLDELGPYAADKAAFTLLIKLEKSKIRVPYERHFLLLRLCTTALVKIRCHTESVLDKYESDWDRIRLFSTPKVMRFVEILEQFTPKTEVVDENKAKNSDIATKTEEMLKEIDSCDFASLGNRIEDKLNSVKANLKDLEGIGHTKENSSGRTRGRVRPSTHAAGALTGVVFMANALMPRIVFMLCADLTRSRPSLSFLRSQYCTLEAGAECKDNQKQGKRHEEVLKKFRMHECNLLLTTSALEEGIDLPRCNLVLRWDVPASYRSYGLCRSRGRASRASAAILCSEPNTHTALHNMAVYTELDHIITRKCGCGIQDEPTQEEEVFADKFTSLIKAYTPNEAKNNCICRTKLKHQENSGSSENVELSEQKASENEIEISELKLGEKDISDVKLSEKGISDVKFDEKGISELKLGEKEISELNIGEREVTEQKISESASRTNKNGLNIENIPNKLTESVDVISENMKNVRLSSDDNNSDKICSCDCSDKDSDVARVDLSTAIALINRYCAKLPSDTFTRLAPQWWIEKVKLPNIDREAFICTLRLPLNCPLKYNIVGHPMPTRVLARRMVALQACRILHKSGELDDQLMPIGKENFKAAEMDKAHVNDKDDDSARPGTTKRRQYYYKRTASAFTDCEPVVDTSDSEITADVKNDDKNIEGEHRYAEASNVDTEDKLNPGNGDGEDILKANVVDEVKTDVTKEMGKETEEQPELLTKCKNEDNVNEVSDNAEDKLVSVNAESDNSTKSKNTNGKCNVDVNIDSSKENTKNTEEKPDPKVNKKNAEGKRNMLYAIESSLWCALPERYNTRGRRLHAPQNASQALAILMARTRDTDLQIPAFPVYTRSGEVRVCVTHVPDADVRMSPRRGRLVRRFMRFVFTEVLRVRRRGMKLQSEGSTKNNYYIVPTIKTLREDGTTKIDIDWPFLELIYHHTEDKKLSDVEKPLPWYTGEDQSEKPVDKAETPKEEGCLENPLLKKGEVFVFDVDKYKEAVVTPWYRNQDQPQFFLVAEICWNLTPDSAFPSEAHSSFRSYYRAKYNVTLTQPDQPLLDVDHTSARLNLLTPRYVNRKGVALPVSSERTRRAKRDRLDQKQILVPELCQVHPFAAPLWFATVALPCVLYRINALLIADEIRRAVAIEVGLGIPRIDDKSMPSFKWPPLDFGWSLSEVLNADAEKSEKKKEEERDKEKEKYKELREAEVKQKPQTEELNTKEESEEKTINDILQEKEYSESGFEIGTWSNEMASSIPDSQFDELMEPLPPNLTFCTSASGGLNWCDTIPKTKQYNSNRVYSVADSDCSYMSSDFDTDDSDFDHEGSDEDNDVSGFCSSRTSNNAVGVRIEYKTAHEAEAVDVETRRNVRPAPARDQRSDEMDMVEMMEMMRSGDPDLEYVQKFRKSVEDHERNIMEKNHLVTKEKPITELLPKAPDTRDIMAKNAKSSEEIDQIFPQQTKIELNNGQITLESIERNKRVLLSELKRSLPDEEIKKLNCFSMVDVDIDSPDYVNEKIVNVGFDSPAKYIERVLSFKKREFQPYYMENRGQSGKEYDFDFQPDLEGHPGPSPSVILQALTMSNANDGINLERLETIGDSFLKFAITAYLYCAHPTVHEGKLSHMRSKQVSNLNLYRLGRAKRLGGRMIASKFEPHDNWLPPCHKPPPGPDTLHIDSEGKCEQDNTTGCYIPYNLITQHSIPDKSIADCVEALIGAYLLECGARGALLFMSWLGITVLPQHRLTPPAALRRIAGQKQSRSQARRRRSSSSSSSPLSSHSECDEDDDVITNAGAVGAKRPYRDHNGQWVQIVYGELKAPPSPLLRYIEDPEGELEQMLSGYDALERTLQYRFRDRSLLLQALTHASHHRNRLTDCYQRLEFLGDAILDYLITRHLYEDARRHCPGALTDLRSALVNNTIFATLAVRHGFHKYFRHMSPGLNEVLTKYVKIQEENGHSISEEHYLIQEDELEQAEDVEVPKALGDLFESVAGAIFLDSGMSLGAVWQSYVRLMGEELEAFSAAAPKSPVRELLEAEPDTAKFGKPERLADGRRVRVCVEVFGRGTFKGIGRNYRIAKGTAARCALRHLKGHRR